MTGRGGVVLGAVVLLCTATTGTAAAAEEVTRFTDPRITESSGLAVVGEQWVTVNDSGDSGRLFVVDPATGDTRRTVEYPGDAVDVEALAPAGRDAVWVGDIGDNRGRRGHVSLYRVGLGTDRVQRIDLRYPDRARDAEALVRHPVTGELFVITKQVFGARVLRVPPVAVRTAARTGHASGVLQPVGAAPGLVTDGSFTSDGRHLLLRTYHRLHVLAWPSGVTVARVDLPQQRQGESLAVQGTTVLIGSEGLREPVLAVENPVLATIEPSPVPRAAPTATPPAASPRPLAPDNPSNSGSALPEWWPWAAGTGLLIGVIALVGTARGRARTSEPREGSAGPDRSPNSRS